VKTGREVGVEEDCSIKIENQRAKTIMGENLNLPRDQKCRVFDITGRIVKLANVQVGKYFVEIEGRSFRKW